MTDIITAHGAAYKNHDPQEISIPNSDSINPNQTIFLAAAVLIPIFQMEIDCTAVIISNADSLLSFAKPNAAVIPIKIGTNVPARAVALGTNNASTKLTKIVPITRRPGCVPTFDII